MITKHNLNPTNKKQDAMALISRSITKEFLWTKNEVEQMTHKVKVDYGITESELKVIFSGVEYKLIENPETLLEKLFNECYVSEAALRDIVDYITGQDRNKWRQNNFRESLDNELSEGIELLGKKYTEATWQLDGEYYKAEEELKEQHIQIMKRLSLNEPTYYRNDLYFSELWNDILEKAKIF